MKVIDNFLKPELFNHLSEEILAVPFPWHHAPSVAKPDSEDGSYFFSNIYIHDVPRVDIFNVLYDEVVPLLPDFHCLIRIKANLYPRTSQLVKHGFHTDFDLPHKGLLLYLNTCNGYTENVDGKKVHSVANRALIHDPNVMHRSTTCTDEARRVVLVFNYV